MLRCPFPPAAWRQAILRCALVALVLGPCCAPASLAARPPRAAASAVDARLRGILLRAQATAAAPAAAAPAAHPWWNGADVVRQVSSRASALVVNALSFLGEPYRYGGDRASKGFDCSGLVRRVYKETLGLVLPHNAAAQSREGEKVAKNQLRPGDLVFFNTLRRAFSHVGIYIGDGRFVHAPRPGQSVRISDLDSPYWKRRFDGARRLIIGAVDPLRSAQAAPAEPRQAPAASAGPAVPDQVRPVAVLPVSDAVPARASASTTALMAGALLPRSGANAAP